MLFDIFNKYVIAYLNNILIYNNLHIKYRWHVCNILSRFIKARLTFNICKYKFYTTKTKYLRLIISTEKI